MQQEGERRENVAGRREERERSREKGGERTQQGGRRETGQQYLFSGSPREKFNTIPLYSVSGSPCMNSAKLSLKMELIRTLSDLMHL